MNRLNDFVRDYLHMRRRLGYKLPGVSTMLFDFVMFLEQHGAEHITNQLALKWATKPQSVQPAHWARRLRILRGFAQYLTAIDERTEVPSSTLLPFPSKRGRPYIYTDNEVRQILQAALNFPKATEFKRQTYYFLLGLLAVSGLRISEALSLRLCHLDLVAGLLTVEGSKFGKSRLIAIHESTQRALLDYLSCRERFLNGRVSDWLFVSTMGRRTGGDRIRRIFKELSKQIGIREKQSKRGPRLHDFRHTFAVKTILNWYENGENVESRLPALSTFLGHVRVADTYWYLSACPALMQEAVKRIEKWWEETL